MGMTEALGHCSNGEGRDLKPNCGDSKATNMTET
jgi:hypothetical protein